MSAVRSTHWSVMPVRLLQFDDIVRQLKTAPSATSIAVHELISRIHGGLSDLRHSETRTPQDSSCAPQSMQAELDNTSPRS